MYGESLLPGRVYNLDASLASALMLDGCADLYESLSAEEKRDLHSGARSQAWTHDGRTQWRLPDARFSRLTQLFPNRGKPTD
jgi:hypothetical protein